MENDREGRRARRRAGALRGFHIHSSVYLAVMTLLLAIDLADGGGWWVQFPALAWGIGLVAHAVAVFDRATPAHKGFHLHFSVFLAVMLLLLAANLTGGGGWWVQFPFLAWGIGVAAHAASVFDVPALLTAMSVPMAASAIEARFQPAGTGFPDLKVAELKSRFGTLDRRLAEMEAGVTADEFSLRRKFRDLDA